jgi:uncharacterized protein (TIGR01777 family)
MSNQVVVTGANGWIGGHACRVLRRLGWDVIGVSRTPAAALAEHPQWRWIGVDDDELEQAVIEAGRVLNLAGRNAFEQPWTTDFVDAMRSSRIGITTRIVEALARTRNVDPSLVSASGYPVCGDGGERELDDSVPASHELVLGDIDAEWEAVAARAAGGPARVAIMRIGLVLGADGGGFPVLRQPFDAGHGVVLGSGRQWLPWIHLVDVVGLLVEALTDSGYRGVVNAVAPQPARHAELAQAMGEALGVPWQTRVSVDQVVQALGGASELVLHSHRLVPSKALARGFHFAHPDITGAVEYIVAD